MRVIFFIGIRTTLRDLFSACVPTHPLELYRLFKDGKFTFLREDKEDLHHLSDLHSKITSHEASTFVVTDILKLIDYFRKLWLSIDNKSLDTPIAVADEVITDYEPTNYYSGEQRTGLDDDLKIVKMADNLEEYAKRIGLRNFEVGVFIKTII